MMGFLLEVWGLVTGAATWLTTNLLLAATGGIWLLLMGMLPFAVPSWLKLLTWPIGALLMAFLAYQAGGVGAYRSGLAAGEKAERQAWEQRLVAARAEERRKAATELAEKQRKIDALAAVADAATRSYVDFVDGSSSEGEAQARAMIRRIEAIRAEYEALLKQVEVPPDFRPPVTVICEKPNEKIQCPAVPACPPVRLCKPALLQPVPGEFVR